MNRAQKVLTRLHKRAFALSHPNRNHDMAEVLQGLALVLEMQREIAITQVEIAEKLKPRSARDVKTDSRSGLQRI
jgi:hypothetical protein